MSNRKVYVAVDLDLGWDNVIGVFDSMDKARSACQPVGDEWDDEYYVNKINDRTGIYDMHHIHVKEVQ
jgi:hypothetical protein